MAKKISANDKPNRAGERRSGPPREFRYPFKQTRTVILLSIASALILTLAFPPANLSFLAYFGLVPLIIAIVLAKTTRAAVLSSLLAGVIFFGINCYWLFIVTILGTIPLLAYLACYFALFAWAVRRIRASTRWPLTILAPVVWVSLEYIRSILLTGFPWLYLGHTQFENLTLIQIADVTGAYGISFLAAMTGGLVADFLTRPLFLRYGGHIKFSRSLLAMTLIVIAAWMLTLVYGRYRLGQQAARPGPLIATIQGNVPQKVKRSAKYRDIVADEKFMLDQHIALTEEAIASAEPIDLIIWPETMVPGPINPEFLNVDLDKLVRDRRLIAQLRDAQLRNRVYWRQVKRLAARTKADMLVGVPAINFTGAHAADDFLVREGNRYNSAILIKPDTPDFACAHRYDKVHLVLFGEYVPFRWWPAMYGFLQSLTPYPFDYSLTAGDVEQAPFETDGIRYAVAICYEGAMPHRIREMTMEDGKKRIDFLVNISNDGWFINPAWCPGPVPSTELDQHLNLYVFRAVENRLGIVRAVNTGVSAFIAPNGKIEKIVRLPNGMRHNVRGYLVDKVLVDRRVTFYSRWGDWFARLCLAASVILVLLTIAGDLKRQRRGKQG